MNLDSVKEKLEGLLADKFQEEDYQDCFLVDISISKSARVQVFLDCDSGLNLATCGKLSRYLEKWLDESLVLGEKYILEVSSPGVERPLIKRQYPKNIGRKIRVKKKDGEVIDGKLEAVSEKGIQVELQLSKKEVKSLDITFEEINESIIIVSF
jgi:ribosome maturation factor RimP